MSYLIKIINEPERQLRIIPDPHADSFIQLQVEANHDEAYIDLSKCEVVDLIHALETWLDSEP